MSVSFRGWRRCGGEYIAGRTRCEINFGGRARSVLAWRISIQQGDHMIKTRSLIIALLGIVSLTSARTALAQEFPGLGVGDIYRANMEFDRQFDIDARRISWE